MDVLGEMPKRDGADVFFSFPGVHSAVSLFASIAKKITNGKIAERGSLVINDSCHFETLRVLHYLR